MPFAGVGLEDHFRTLLPTKDLVQALRSNPITAGALENVLSSIDLPDVELK